MAYRATTQLTKREVIGISQNNNNVAEILRSHGISAKQLAVETGLSLGTCQALLQPYGRFSAQTATIITQWVVEHIDPRATVATLFHDGNLRDQGGRQPLQRGSARRDTRRKLQVCHACWLETPAHTGTCAHCEAPLHC